MPYPCVTCKRWYSGLSPVAAAANCAKGVGKMAAYYRTNRGPLCFCGGLLSACLLIFVVLWPSAEKPLQLKFNSRDVAASTQTPGIPASRNSIDEKKLFSFVPPGLANCDELFIGIPPANLEFQNEYNILFNSMKTILINMRTRIEGNSGELEKQTLTYQTLAKADFVKTVCETGFNAGHSALVFLSTKADIHHYAFDLGAHSYGRPMMELLQKTFPGRLNVTWGDSKVTLPAFAKAHPNVKCDIVIVDGGHNYPEAKADLRNFRPLTNKNHNLLIIDDHPANSVPGVKKAWEEELSAMQLQEHFKCNFFSNKVRGFTVGKYINL